MRKTAVRLILVGLLVMIGVSINACRPKSAELPPLPEGWKWYHSEEEGFRIGIPTEWEAVKQDLWVELQPSTKDARVAIITEEADFSSLDDLAASVYRQNSLDYYGSGHEATFYKKGEPIWINNREGREISEEVASLRRHHFLFLVDDMTYVVACESPDFLYQRYKSTFEAILNTFVIE